MRRWMPIFVAGVILVGCTTGESAPATPRAPLAETEPRTTPGSAPTPRPSKTDVAVAGSSKGSATPTPRDVDLVKKFVRFAANPQERTFQRFGPSVELGLGEELVAERSAQALHSDRAWVLGTKDTIFRAYTGPFSAVKLVRDHLEDASAEGVRPSDAYTVTVGPHRHCASPPVPAPKKVRNLRRVAVLPSSESIEHIGCLRWFSVDLFVDDAGKVRAITLDVWEP